MSARLSSLPAPIFRLVAAARDLASERGLRLYLAGGAVRDLLLRRTIHDIDLVVAGDASPFARSLAGRLGASARFHPRFGTATLELAGGVRLDVAAARAESYERPGALPRVRPGSIAEDLARRDFSVNAMALEITPGDRPRLLDPFGGRDDLRRGLVRTLHPGSITDDPTRAYRAVRYANRLGFRIKRATRDGIRKVVRRGAVDAVSGDRLRREITLLLSEGDRAAAVRLMAALGLGKAIHPALRHDSRVGQRLRAAERLAGESGAGSTWLLYLLVWIGASSEDAARAIAKRLNLGREAGRIVRAWPATSRALEAVSGQSRSRLARRIEKLSPDEVLAAAAASRPPLRRRILDARRVATGVSLTVRGEDLLAAGIPPGPAIGRALERTLSARREGSIRREEELPFALKAARS